VSESQLKKLTKTVKKKEKEIADNITKLKEAPPTEEKKKTILGTIRSYTNAQIAIIRGFLFLVMGMVARDSFLEHSAGDFDMRSYIELGILVLLIAFTFAFERHNNSIEDQREQAQNESRMKFLAQHFAIQFFFSNVLRQKNLSLDDTVELLKQAPKIITMVNPSKLSEDVNQGFTMVADAMNSITLNFKESYNKIEKRLETVNNLVETKISKALEEVGIVNKKADKISEIKDLIQQDINKVAGSMVEDFEELVEETEEEVEDLLDEMVEYVDEE
jgi:DNA-binding ferritin-like protein (Dps family)